MAGVVTRQRLAVVGRVLLAALTLCPAAMASAQTPGMQGEQVGVVYGRAVTAFNSGDITSAQPLLDQAIDGVSSLADPLSTPQRNWLVHSLALRAQLRLDLDNTTGADDDVSWLLHLDPDYRFDRTVVSPKLITLVDDARAKQSGRIRFPASNQAKLWIDGRRVDGTQVLAATPGSHDVTVEIGLNRQSMAITVGNRAVDVNWPAAIATTSTTSTQVSQRQLPGGGGSSSFLQVFVHPPRILFARLDGVLDTKERKRLDRPQVAGALRVWKYLAVGATRVQTTGNFDNVHAIDPSDPEGVRGVPVGPTFSGLELSRDIWHIEIAGTGGNDNWEGYFYAGPSFVTATIGVPRTNLNDEFKTLGGNLGFDVSWFPLRYVGVGGGARYTRAILNLNLRAGETKLILEAAQVSVGARFRF